MWKMCGVGSEGSVECLEGLIVRGAVGLIAITLSRKKKNLTILVAEIRNDLPTIQLEEREV
jgi:hypothetical protein